MPRRRTALAASHVLVALLLAGAGGVLAPLPAGAQAPAAGFENELPFWVWRALPQVFPEYIPGPGGYLSFGFEWNRGEQLPVGLTLIDGAVPRIRTDLGPAGVGGAPADMAGYRGFLIAAANDPRFTADNILPIIRYNVRLSLLDRLRYRYLVIPKAREALLRLAER
jgi:hypothetical protein